MLETENNESGFLKSTWSKVAALLAALGLGAGLTFTVTQDGCDMKRNTPSADAGVEAGEGEVLPVDSSSSVGQ